jgi:protein-S-isoprenylcysteine O-methyltransferase Ste14
MLLPLSSHAGWFGRPFALPDAWLIPLMAMGTALGVFGGALTVWALTHLRRNFSIFVEVRNVVLTGPYRYVRHPMYLGEITMTAGLVLSMMSPFSIALLATFAILQYVRGRMEQMRLCEASPQYAEHMASSGMFLPKA